MVCQVKLYSFCTVESPLGISPGTSMKVLASPGGLGMFPKAVPWFPIHPIHSNNPPKMRSTRSSEWTL